MSQHKLVPVDHDPFEKPKQTHVLVPVQHNPFTHAAVPVEHNPFAAEEGESDG